MANGGRVTFRSGQFDPTQLYLTRTPSFFCQVTSLYPHQTPHIYDSCNPFSNVPGRVHTHWVRFGLHRWGIQNFILKRKNLLRVRFKLQPKAHSTYCVTIRALASCVQYATPNYIYSFLGHNLVNKGNTLNSDLPI